MNYRRPSSNNKRELLKYAAMGSQILALLAISIFLGLKADQWLRTSPLFACALPLISLVGMFVRIYQDTSRKK
jgi:hypothetical protein